MFNNIIEAILTDCYFILLNPLNNEQIFEERKSSFAIAQNLLCGSYLTNFRPKSPSGWNSSHTCAHRKSTSISIWLDLNEPCVMISIRKVYTPNDPHPRKTDRGQSVPNLIRSNLTESKHPSAVAPVRFVPIPQPGQNQYFTVNFQFAFPPPPPPREHG